MTILYFYKLRNYNIIFLKIKGILSVNIRTSVFKILRCYHEPKDDKPYKSILRLKLCNLSFVSKELSAFVSEKGRI